MASRVRTPLSGDLFAPYELVGELGVRPVAVYVLRQPAQGTSRAQILIGECFAGAARAGDARTAELQRDARRMTTLANPSLPRVREVNVRGDDLVVLSEFVDGEKLRALWQFDAERLPLELALRVLVDVLTGVSALHGLRDVRQQPLRIVHGELSPATILFGLDGVARVLHSVARRVPGVRPEPESSAYLAPEVVSGEPFDARADVFSVGALLWEALDGNPLFPETGATPGALRESPVPPPSVPEKAPWAKALAAVATRALSASPDDRWPTAAAMAAEIRKASGLKLAPASSAAAYAKRMFGDRAKARRATFEGPTVNADATPTPPAESPVSPAAPRVASPAAPAVVASRAPAPKAPAAPAPPPAPAVTAPLPPAVPSPPAPPVVSRGPAPPLPSVAARRQAPPLPAAALGPSSPPPLPVSRAPVAEPEPTIALTPSPAAAIAPARVHILAEPSLPTRSEPPQSPSIQRSPSVDDEVALESLPPSVVPTAPLPGADGFAAAPKFVAPPPPRLPSSLGPAVAPAGSSEPRRTPPVEAVTVDVPISVVPMRPEQGSETSPSLARVAEVVERRRRLSRVVIGGVAALGGLVFVLVGWHLVHRVPEPIARDEVSVEVAPNVGSPAPAPSPLASASGTADVSTAAASPAPPSPTPASPPPPPPAIVVDPSPATVRAAAPATPPRTPARASVAVAPAPSPRAPAAPVARPKPHPKPSFDPNSL